MTESDIWKIQYENFIRLMSDEANRFWTRFQVFLAVNGGLLAVFPIVLGLYSGALEELTEFTKPMLIVISIIGILESLLWVTITLSGRETQNFYRDQVGKLEDKKELDIRIAPSKEERNKPTFYSITILSLGLPILFVVLWALIFSLGISTDFGMPPIENTDST